MLQLVANEALKVDHPKHVLRWSLSTDAKGMWLFLFLSPEVAFALSISCLISRGFHRGVITFLHWRCMFTMCTELNWNLASF